MKGVKGEGGQDIPKAQDSKAGKHCGTGKCTMTPCIYLAQCSKDIVHTSSSFASFAKGIGESIKPEEWVLG